MANLLPSKKATLGRNIQINLKKVEGKKPSSTTNNNNTRKIETNKLQPSPRNLKNNNLLSHKKEKNSSNAETRDDRFVYSRKKVPRTNEESGVKNKKTSQMMGPPSPRVAGSQPPSPRVVGSQPTSPRVAGLQKKKVVQNPKKQPQANEVFSTGIKNKNNRSHEESGKFFTENSTASFLSPKAGKHPSEHVNESLVKLVGNSKLSTIKPIKVQKIEVIEQQDASSKHKVIQTKIDTIQITNENNKYDDFHKGIFTNAHIKTDVSFSDLNHTDESEGGRLSEMIESFVNRKDSLF